MIKAERLKELIEKVATIFHYICEYGIIEEFNLKGCELYNDFDNIQLVYENEPYDLENLYKTKAEAEFVSKYKNIKRYGKTYKNAEEIYNFIKDKKDVVLVSIDELEQKDKRIAELEEELAELKENAIVPKFNFGDTIFAVVTYFADPKDKTVIESGIVQKIECDKNQIKYWCDNGRIYWEDECEKLFATKAEAEKALKELK